MRYVDGVAVESFVADSLRVDGVERCIERICAAAIKLGTDRLRTLRIELDGAVLRGLGIVLRHEYDAVDAVLTYNIATQRLPVLRDQCAIALAKMTGDGA
jgi:uncharacterized protein with HEPN domain